MLLARRLNQAEALRKELATVKDKAKAYITKLNEVNGRTNERSCRFDDVPRMA